MRSMLSGNLVAVGGFSGTQDLDPGPGVQEVEALETDGFIVVLNDLGDWVWSGSFEATGDAACRGVAVDATGAIHVVGYFAGILDADPGPDVTFLTSVDDWDVFWVKLSPSGDLQWAGQLGGPGRQFPFQLESGPDGSVVISGSNFGTMDADPGVDVYEVAQGAFIARYDDSVAPLWVNRLPGLEVFFGVDPITSRIIAGTGTEVISPGTADFDPGPGTLDPLSGDLPAADIMVILAFDQGGSLMDHHIVRGYADFDGWDNRPQRIAVGVDGSAYVSGGFISDFSAYPGNSVTLDAPSTGSDGFLLKFDEDLELIWEKRFGAPIVSEGCSDVLLDDDGRVWVGGSIGNGGEVNSVGPSVTVAASGGSLDGFLAAFSLDGEYIWHGTYGGPNELPDGSPRFGLHHGQLCFGAFFRDVADLDVSSTVDLRTSLGLSDAFVSCFEIAGLPTFSVEHVGEWPLKLYPNPTSELLALEVPAEWTGAGIEVRSIDGRIVQRGSIHPSGGRVILDVRGLLPGVYTVSIHHGKGRTGGMVVVE